MFDTCIVTTTKISTEELQDLKTKGLPIVFLDDPSIYYDDVGGFHDCSTGWNPKGMYCGECTRVSCKDCEGECYEKN